MDSPHRALQGAVLHLENEAWGRGQEGAHLVPTGQFLGLFLVSLKRSTSLTRATSAGS